jgi:hypothetical protein
MLVTLILDYAGGTYLAQAEVRNISAFSECLRTAFDWSAMSPAPTLRDVTTFIGSVGEGRPVEVSPLSQVWCVSGLLGDNLALLHIVNTVAGSAVIEETQW